MQEEEDLAAPCNLVEGPNNLFSAAPNCSYHSKAYYKRSYHTSGETYRTCRLNYC